MTAAKTVAEALKQLTALEARRAVWQELVNYLRRFVQDEVSRPDSSIATDQGVPVGQDVVRELIEEMVEQQIDPLSQEIAAIQGRPIGVEEVDAEKDQGQASEVEAVAGATRKRPRLIRKAVGS